MAEELLFVPPFARDAQQPVDLWEELDAAEENVEAWPAWRKRYEADVFGESDPATPSPADV